MVLKKIYLFLIFLSFFIFFIFGETQTEDLQEDSLSLEGTQINKIIAGENLNEKINFNTVDYYDILFEGELSKQILYQTVFSPFNIYFDLISTGLKVDDKRDRYVNLDSYFLDILNYKSKSSVSLSSNRFCKVGGDYDLFRYAFPDFKDVEQPSIHRGTLFSCKTTLDLIKRTNIPSSWVNGNILVYCNDGSEISSVMDNFDYLLRNIKAYKVCLIKNLDTDKIILSGFDSGNKAVDSFISKSFYDTDLKSGGIIGGELAFEGDTLKYNGEGNYRFEYSTENDGIDDTYFFLSNSDESMDNSLSTIFSLNDDQYKLSRVFLMKSFDGKKVIGFEEPLSLYKKGERVYPIYNIIFLGINLNQDFCVDSLAYYDAKIGPDMQFSDKITCENNKIRLNTLAIDGTNYGQRVEIDTNDVDDNGDSKEKIGDGKADSFKLFKNIIISSGKFADKDS